MFNKLNILPGQKTFLWAFYLMFTGLLKMFAGDLMPPAVDFLAMDPSTYISMGVSLLFLRFAVKNG